MICLFYVVWVFKCMCNLGCILFFFWLREMSWKYVNVDFIFMIVCMVSGFMLLLRIVVKWFDVIMVVWNCGGERLEYGVNCLLGKFLKF